MTLAPPLFRRQYTNDLIENCDMPLPKPNNEAGYQQNTHIEGINFYRVTLVVSTEQENAIIDLFREKQWAYRKLDYKSDSTQNLNVESNSHVSKDKAMFLEPFSSEQPFTHFLEENEAEDIGPDCHILPAVSKATTTMGHALHSNCSLPHELVQRNGVAKDISNEGRNLNCITLHDPNKDSSIQDVLYHDNKTGGAESKTWKRIGHLKDKPVTETVVSQGYERVIFESIPFANNAVELQEEEYTTQLSTIVKTETQSDCPSIIIKVEPEPQQIDNTAYDGVSNEVEKHLSPVLSNSKPSSKSDSVTSNINCEECGRTFKLRVFYDKHLTEGRCKQICGTCGKVFRGRKLNIRYEKHLKIGRCKQANLICEICGKEYTGRHRGWKLKSHMESHNKQYDHECRICGKRFIHKAKLVQHVKSHADPKPKICDKCGQRFSTTLTLKVHMAKHVKNRDVIQCSKCTKMYITQSGLWNHMRSVHDTSTFFPCLTCNKTFKHKKRLRLHELTHKDTRDFKCDLCDASFKQPGQLFSHKKRHTKTYSVFCKICNQGFYEKRNLKEHENIHTGAKPYMCSLCDYRCAYKYNLPKHIKNVHGQ